MSQISLFYEIESLLKDILSSSPCWTPCAFQRQCCKDFQSSGNRPWGKFLLSDSGAGVGDSELGVIEDELGIGEDEDND